MPTPQGFSNINVATGSRDALRSLAYTLTGLAGRRVTLSDALRAACVVATDNPQATLAALNKEGSDA